MSEESIRNENNKKKLKSELDNLMIGFTETFGEKSGNANASNIIGNKIEEIGRPAKTYDFDFEKLDTQFKAKAGELINSMFDFYLDAGVIDKISYTKHKRDLDTSNISNMLWQLKTVKITISILMDEIVAGNTSPKTISALSDMQDRFSGIIRMQANYVMFLEDTYKKMKYEAAEANTDQDLLESGEKPKLERAREEAASSEYFLTANPKELIRQITEVNPLTDEEHEQMKAEGEECIHGGIGTKNTNPKLKEELMTELNLDIEKKDESSNDYDSILDMI